jgi:hypothetical protein
MDHQREALERVIQSINWRKIKSYHKRLDIFWEFQEDKQIIRRIPNVAELKEELKSIFEHMLAQNLSYISYGSWIVFWDREEAQIGDIRVIFRLADFEFEEEKQTRESLEFALEKAIEKEDYEYAAELRDVLQKNYSNISGSKE